VNQHDSPRDALHASGSHRPPHPPPVTEVPALPALVPLPPLPPFSDAEVAQTQARLLQMILDEIPRHLALAASLQHFEFLTHDDLDELAAKIARAAVVRPDKAKDYCRSDQAMLSWAMRCLRNMVLDFVASKLSRAHAEGAFVLESDGEDDAWSNPEAAMAERELEAAREAAFAALPPEHQMALDCIEMKGMSYAQTAALMKLSLSAVKRRLEDARALLCEAENAVREDRAFNPWAKRKVKAKAKPKPKPKSGTNLRIFRTGERDA
jgi:RNA polymerase sigma-70 factor (ECF subfamily)